jgi:hypothetical protein
MKAVSSWALIVSLAAGFSGAVAHSALPVTECVGRMELNLPGPGVVAATPPRERRAAGDVLLFEKDSFEDGVLSGYSSLRFDGPVEVTHALTEQRWQWLLKGMKNLLVWGDVEGTLTYRDNEPRISGAPRSLQPNLLERLEGVNWGSLSLGALVRLGGHALSWESASKGEQSLHTLKAIDGGLALRPAGTSPQRQGVCLPYFFIPDDGTTPRSISMTFRLLDHPDVLINFEDASAARLGPSARLTAKDPDDMTLWHWAQHTFQTRVERLGFPWMRNTHMAGNRALSTKVRLTRLADQGAYKAGDVNYAYLSLVRGDPDATSDTPDLRLYIIQRAHLAQSKGITPLNEEQFFELADAIRKSVRRRPLQP